MKLYMKQKVFSLKDKFTIKDEDGNDKYFVEGEMWAFGKKLHVYDTKRNEVAFIREQIWSLLPTFRVFCNGEQVADVKCKFSFLVPKYTIKGLDWEVKGKMTAHNYKILQGKHTIVTISKKWMTWADTYELDITKDADEIIALATVLAIDCEMARTRVALTSD